jgi:16S rRNA U516 pseudouridylate synthase RsuA-like enzyme
VRIIVAAAGLEVVYLRRTRIGGLRMPPGLEPGKYM